MPFCFGMIFVLYLGHAGFFIRDHSRFSFLSEKQKTVFGFKKDMS